jgi:hypothetical protein
MASAMPPSLGFLGLASVPELAFVTVVAAVLIAVLINMRR